jgi:hypothetical protein
MEKRDSGGPVRVGMKWGSIGGVVGFLASLLGSLAGVVIAGFIGVSCGRRAAEAVAERSAGAGALAGLVGGSVAAPVFVLGASVGAIVAARGIGAQSIADAVSEFMGMEISPDEAWQLFLLSVLAAGVLQAAVLILASVAAGAWSLRKE